MESIKGKEDEKKCRYGLRLDCKECLFQVLCLNEDNDDTDAKWKSEWEQN